MPITTEQSAYATPKQINVNPVYVNFKSEEGYLSLIAFHNAKPTDMENLASSLAKVLKSPVSIVGYTGVKNAYGDTVIFPTPNLWEIIKTWLFKKLN